MEPAARPEGGQSSAVKAEPIHAPASTTNA